MGLIKGNIENKTYAYVLSDGFIRVKVEEGTEGAIERAYDTPSGESGTKFELVFAKLEGIIKRIGFKETEFGKFLEVDVQDSKDEKATCLSLNVENSFAQDLMKKIPNIRIGERLTLVPYSMDKKETGKTKRGITVYQDNKKVQSFFYDPKTKQNINGFPSVDEEKAKTYDKDDWKIYFLSVKKFLVKNTEENVALFEIAKPEVVESCDSESEITIEDVNALIPGEVQMEIPQPTPASKPIPDAPFHTKTEMLTIIAEMAKAKFGSLTPDSVKEDVMNATGLAFINANLEKIITALDKLPNKK